MLPPVSLRDNAPSGRNKLSAPQVRFGRSFPVKNDRSYRKCAGEDAFAPDRTFGGGLTSIRPFQVSRWRLRWTRHLWVFNGVLVREYGLEGAFVGWSGSTLRVADRDGEAGYCGDFGSVAGAAIG